MSDFLWFSTEWVEYVVITMVTNTTLNVYGSKELCHSQHSIDQMYNIQHGD